MEHLEAQERTNGDSFDLMEELDKIAMIFDDGQDSQSGDTHSICL